VGAPEHNLFLYLHDVNKAALEHNLSFFPGGDPNNGALKYNVHCPLVTLFGFCSCGSALGVLSLSSFPPLQGALFDVLVRVSSCQLSTHFTFTVCQARFVKLRSCQVAIRVHFLKLLITVRM